MLNKKTTDTMYISAPLTFSLFSEFKRGQVVRNNIMELLKICNSIFDTMASIPA